MQARFLFYFKISFDQKEGVGMGGEEKSAWKPQCIIQSSLLLFPAPLQKPVRGVVTKRSVPMEPAVGDGKQRAGDADLFPTKLSPFPCPNWAVKLIIISFGGQPTANFSQTTHATPHSTTYLAVLSVSHPKQQMGRIA